LILTDDVHDLRPDSVPILIDIEWTGDERATARSSLLILLVPAMGSPGRVVQRGGKSMYEALVADDPDAGGGLVDSERTFKNCPNERTTWPEYDSSICSRMWFIWFNPIVKLGAKLPLEMTDLWVLHNKESSAKNVPEFMNLWEKERQRAAAKGEKPGLLRPVWQHSWRVVVPAGVLLLMGCLTQFIPGLLTQGVPGPVPWDPLKTQYNTLKTLLGPPDFGLRDLWLSESYHPRFIRPLLMMQILLIVEDSPEAIVPREQGWLLAFAMAVTAVADFLSFSHYNMWVMKSAWRLRQALVGLLFSKVTKLSQGTKSSYSQGKIQGSPAGPIRIARAGYESSF
jgi:hypothetical protein